MSDAPMTPREFAESIANGIMETVRGKDFDLIAYITDHDAAIRREAQAEALEQIMDFLDAQTPEDADTTHWAARAYQAIGALMPESNYRDRIVAQARQMEAEWWFAHQLCRDKFLARLNEIEADVKHLAAADAEKPAEGAR